MPLQMLSLPAAPHKVGKTLLSGFHLHLQTVTELINPRYRHFDRSLLHHNCSSETQTQGDPRGYGGGWGCLSLCYSVVHPWHQMCLSSHYGPLLSLFQVTPELLQPRLLNTAWADSVCFQCFNVYQTDLAQVARIPLLIWCKTLIILLLTRV